MTVNSTPIFTKFAPAERTSAIELQTQARFFESLPLLGPLLAAIPEGVLILNQYRQIVFANSAFLTLFDFPDLPSAIGFRPGEAINCEHAFDTAGGCGTTESCSTCGAVKSILRAQDGIKNSEECRISTKSDKKEVDSLDLRVVSTPQYFEGNQYTIFTIADISSEKRRRILERIFFHDITNTAGAIYGLADILNDATSMEELEEFGFGEILSQASSRLLDEILAQSQLLSAENGELASKPDYFYTGSFLQDLISLYQNHPIAEDRNLQLDRSIENILILSDRALLGRVIGNMIKNALEASSIGETVTVGCQKLFDYARIWVHNPKHIPHHVQLQIFQRSFSTKGNDRGLGTYSMKLLSEKYLQGRVSFESTPEDGTVFMGMYPLELRNIETADN